MTKTKSRQLLLEDMIFIEKCIGLVSQELHRRLPWGYFSKLDTIYAKNNNVECMHVNARYEANTFLRVNTQEKAVNV